MSDRITSQTSNLLTIGDRFLVKIELLLDSIFKITKWLLLLVKSLLLLNITNW